MGWVVEAEKAEIMNAYNEEVNQPTAYHLFPMRIHDLSFFRFHCTHRTTTSQLKPSLKWYVIPCGMLNIFQSPIRLTKTQCTQAHKQGNR